MRSIKTLSSYLLHFCAFYAIFLFMEDQSVAFWKRVNDLIKSQGKTQEIVAQNCDISYQTFRGWITRHTFPDGLQTANIAKNLGVSVEFLVTGAEPPNRDAETLDEIKKIMDKRR